MKIVSWNIAGGRRHSPGRLSDNGIDNKDYYADQIRFFDPDVVCLQENLLNGDGQQASYLARELGFPHVFEQSSGVVPNGETNGGVFGLSILSKEPFTKPENRFFPDPPYYPSRHGAYKPVRPTNDKFMQSINYKGVTIANVQLQSFRKWGYDYDHGDGSDYAAKIEDVMLVLEHPVIFAGDFNWNKPQKLYPRLFRKLHLLDALPQKYTLPGYPAEHSQPDHIFYSLDFRVLRSEVARTDSDHLLCFAEFGLANQ